MSEEKKPTPDENNAPEKQPQQTNMLSLPDDVKPMLERAPSPGTAMLTLSWRVIVKIGDQSKTISLKDTIVVGRAAEGDHGEATFDLTPFGAYHYGVSRRHAIMTLKEGYLYLEDLGSTNGTRINGFQLAPNQRYRMRDGDEIEFARLRTTIQFKGPDTP